MTITDIARLAGVSPATVSRVINQKGYVRQELKDKINKVIAETGYLPNQAARLLAHKRAGTIGVIVHNLHDPFFYDLIRGFEQAAQEISYKVIFASILGGDSQSKESYLQYFSGGVVDAVVIHGSYFSDKELLRCISPSSSLDLLLIENDLQEIPCNKLLIDNEHGASAAINYLISRGHRQIAHICGNPNRKVTIDRLNGYLRTMRVRGLEVQDGYLQHLSSDYRIGYDRMRDLLALPSRPTAVFCSDDAIASYAVKAAMDAGLRVPEDISIMGFDFQKNLPDSYRGPKLTTVRQPLYQIGYDSITMLAKQLNQASYEPERIMYETEIIEQETVCDLKR